MGVLSILLVLVSFSFNLVSASRIVTGRVGSPLNEFATEFVPSWNSTMGTFSEVGSLIGIDLSYHNLLVGTLNHLNFAFLPRSLHPQSHVQLPLAEWWGGAGVAKE
ncbi:hypothetical protein FRX31_027146, partial [Thalictrum thalictroides]